MRNTVKSHEPLRFTLTDIRSSDTKGKWWLVGAAWAGDPLNDRAEQSTAPTRQDVESEKLLKLARKQGMNTDIRRSIFLVLMTSEVRLLLPFILVVLTDYTCQDYLDANERLASLHLSEIQQREMIRVLFQCCGSVCCCPLLVSPFLCDPHPGEQLQSLLHFDSTTAVLCFTLA